MSPQKQDEHPHPMPRFVLDIAAIIDFAGFDENDLDMGENGLCGTFALAMKEVFPDAALLLLCHKNDHQSPRLSRGGDPFWKHALVRIDNDLFDINGLVRLEHLIENHCWENPYGTGGLLMPVEQAEYLRIIDDGKSKDDDYLCRWSWKLAESKAALCIPAPVSPVI